jgi:transcriptional regulator with XRE-family HTH domain
MGFAEQLDRAIDMRELTQGQVAVKTGLQQSHISMIRRGQREPSVSIAARLARALDVSLDWLCELPVRAPGALEPDEETVLQLYRRGAREGRGALIIKTVRALAGEDEAA